MKKLFTIGYEGAALVERSSRLVMLARMEGSTALAALEGFTESLNCVHEPMRKSLTYDQGKEMSRHKDWAARTGVTVYFADPHSPWQRGSNDNANGYSWPVRNRSVSETKKNVR